MINTKSQSKLRQILSSKRISLALLSINLSNVISTPFYAGFIVAEALFPIYALAIIIQSQVYIKPINSTWVLESYLNSSPISDFLYIEIAILVIYILMLLMLGYVCFIKDKFNKVKEYSIVQTTLSILINANQTFMSGLYLHIILRVFFISAPTNNIGPFIALQIINVINFIILLWVQVFLKRVFTFKVPFDRQPFAQIDHNSSYLIFLLEIGIILIEVILANFNSMENYLNIISIIVLLFTLLVCLSKLYVVPIFSKTLNTTTNFMLWAILSCSFIVVIDAYDNSVDPINVYYIIILLPFSLGMSYLIQFHWEYHIMDRIRVGQSKMEVQHQYVLYLLTEHVQNLKGDKEHQNQSLKYLFGILDDHNGDCLKNNCLCHQSESIVWILNQKDDENQQIIQLSSEDIEFLNNIQNDMLYTRELYSNAPFTFNDYQDKKYILIRKKHGNPNGDEENDIYSIEFVFEDDKTGENEDEDSFQFRIDPTRLKQAFFANFIRQYYEQTIQKFPESYQIKIMYANFALIQMRNIFLSINILKQIDINKLSFVDKCNFQLNEYMIISEIQNSAMLQENYHQGFQPDLLGVTNFQKVNHKSQTDLRQLDPEGFLNYSRLQERFHFTTLELSKHIMQIWHLISDQVLLVDKVLVQAFQIANLIAQTHQTFKEMDEASKQKNEKIYYNFAIIHQQLLNDSQNYSLYLQKMKNVISMKKFIKSNYQISEQFSDQSILLVSGKMENYGKILECNKQFQRLTGYRWQDLKYSSYEIVMNDLIKQHHQSFVNEFNNTGEKVILDKRVNQFLKKKNGYIIPIQLVVKNHFSDNYGYTFIGFISEIFEIQLDGTSSIGIQTKDLMFLMCDNQEGRIYNVCKNTAKYLGIKKHYLIENSSYLDFEIKSYQISPCLDITQLRELVQTNEGKRDNLFYGIFKLDLNCISQRIQSVFQSTNFVNARFKIFCEQFQNKSFQYYVIVIQLLEKDIVSNNQTLISPDLVGDESAFHQENEANQILIIEERAPSSHTSSDSSKQNDLIKNQNISMERTTPRSLKIVMQLLLVMYVTMITVSGVNLYLSQSRQTKIISQVNVANESSYRLSEVARTRLMVRQLLNIANGVEPNSNAYTNNKTQYVSQNLLSALQNLQNTQNQLTSDQYLFDSDFQDYLENAQMPIQYIDNNGQVYTEQHTMSYLLNIYVTQLLQIYNYNIAQLQTKINIPSLKSYNTGFQPTSRDQTFYFVLKNGNDILNYYVWTVDSMYNQQINEYAQQTVDQTRITILISIFTIIAVAIVVTPIISMIQDRQFTALSFFLAIPKQKIHQLIEQTQFCIDQLNQDDDFDMHQDNDQHNSKSQSLKKQKGGQNRNLSNNSSRMVDDYSQSGFNNDQSMMSYQNAHLNNGVNNSMLNYTKQENTISDNEILVTNNHDKSLYQMDSAMRDDYPQDEEVKHQKKISQISLNSNNHSFGQKRKTLFDTFLKGRFNSNSQSIQLNSQIPSLNNAFDSQAIQKMGPEDLAEFQKIQEQRNIQQAEDQQIELDEKNNKIQAITEYKKKRRVRAIMISFIFMACFCLYFMGSFFITQNIYNEILVLYQNLNTIYHKDTCMENVIDYLRESYAENISYPLYTLDTTQPTQIASTNYLAQCLDLEKQYTDIRRQADPAFNDVKQFMNDIETSSLCDVVYSGTSASATIRSLCSTYYNGILQKGMSNTISIMLSNLNQYDLQFNNMRNRSTSDLKSLIQNQDFLYLIDLKVFFMDQLFTELKSQSFSSVKTYLNTKLSGYIVFFSAFIILVIILVIVTFGWAHGKMRNYLWQINLSMKILPLDSFPNQTIQALKKFFKQ